MSEAVEQRRQTHETRYYYYLKLGVESPIHSLWCHKVLVDSLHTQKSLKESGNLWKLGFLLSLIRAAAATTKTFAAAANHGTTRTPNRSSLVGTGLSQFRRQGPNTPMDPKSMASHVGRRTIGSCIHCRGREE